MITFNIAGYQQSGLIRTHKPTNTFSYR